MARQVQLWNGALQSPLMPSSTSRCTSLRICLLEVTNEEAALHNCLCTSRRAPLRSCSPTSAFGGPWSTARQLSCARAAHRTQGGAERTPEAGWHAADPAPASQRVLECPMSKPESDSTLKRGAAGDIGL
ncbi:hypothetical protein FOA52_011984 [Chlamydomonas sp. UWO 241]|nr:hypothetical protein FOA52_011984 [Chlamydomonas sp. UWO 241]